MTNANVLTQYQSEVIEALKSVANLGKPFEKVIIDTLKLFMAIPDKINFLQMGRYGLFSEQTYRNTFTQDDFDWFSFNLLLADKVCTGKFRAIAVDPSFIPKAGNKTPWFGKYWSGAAASMKRGLELLGVGLIDVENHECMTLGAFQTPNVKALEEMDYNLVDWYRELLISMKDRLQAISKYLVADAFFSKKTFILPLLGKPFSVSSCKSMIHNAYMLERFICVSGLRPDPQVIDRLFKELVLFTSRAA